jgi:hypothetical protein
MRALLLSALLGALILLIKESALNLKALIDFRHESMEALWFESGCQRMMQDAVTNGGQINLQLLQEINQFRSTRLTLQVATDVVGDRTLLQCWVPWPLDVLSNDFVMTRRIDDRVGFSIDGHQFVYFSRAVAIVLPISVTPKSWVFLAVVR